MHFLTLLHGASEIEDHCHLLYYSTRKIVLEKNSFHEDLGQ
jgi:hypothetical protein